MSTSSGAMPIERTFLHRAWLATLAAAVLLTVLILLAVSRPTASGTIVSTPSLGRSPTQGASLAHFHGPIRFDDGTICGQCR